MALLVNTGVAVAGPSTLRGRMTLSRPAMSRRRSTSAKSTGLHSEPGAASFWLSLLPSVAVASPELRKRHRRTASHTLTEGDLSEVPRRAFRKLRLNGLSHRSSFLASVIRLMTILS